MHLRTKYAREIENWTHRQHKASAWLREHRKALTWATSLAGLAGVSWVLAHHGGWAALRHCSVEKPWALLLMVMLGPWNLGIEVTKWRILKRHHVPDSNRHNPWWEVMVGQAAAFAGPFRVGDGVGRIAHWSEGKRQGVVAFGWGALAQGWATWMMAVPALALAGFPLASGALGLATLGFAAWTFRSRAHRAVVAWSLVRYAVFAGQFLASLVAFGALPLSDIGRVGYPKVAALWCAISSIPWPAELGAREWLATAMFDTQLPSVVLATLAVWVWNRAVPAGIGFLMLTRLAVPEPVRA